MTSTNDRNIGQRVAISPGVEVHYIRRGHGQSVIFLHGHMQSLYTWRFLAPFLSDDFCTYALDLPGSGYSDNPEVIYDLPDQAAMLLQFMQAADIQDAHLIGSGMGASLALTTAYLAPERVKKVVAFSPGMLTKGYPLHLRGLGWNFLGRFFAKALRPKHLRDFLLRAHFDETRVDDTMVEQTWLPLLMPGTCQTQSSMAREVNQGHLIESLPKISKPILLLWGEHDTLHPIAGASLYRSSLRDCQFVPLHYTGFMAHEEKARDCADRIRAFLRAPYNES